MVVIKKKMAFVNVNFKAGSAFMMAFADVNF